MTMSLPAFAVEFENKGNNTDIQFKKIMESVYEQLVAQNAEDMYPVYEEIISAQYPAVFSDAARMVVNIISL